MHLEMSYAKLRTFCVELLSLLEIAGRLYMYVHVDELGHQCLRKLLVTCKTFPETTTDYLLVGLLGINSATFERNK